MIQSSVGERDLHMVIDMKKRLDQFRKRNKKICEPRHYVPVRESLLIRIDLFKRSRRILFKNILIFDFCSMGIRQDLVPLHFTFEVNVSGNKGI
jgi:hypothetical protein